jgi:hypothetical protein
MERRKTGRTPTDQELGLLQWTTVLYYLHETNPDSGLVRDKTDLAAPCSIAACGLALATIPVTSSLDSDCMAKQGVRPEPDSPWEFLLPGRAS